MKLHATNVLIAVFVLFIVICVGFTSSVVYSAPIEVGGASNGMFNLNNGGKILEDEGFLFFSDKNDNLYRTETDGSSKPVKIANNVEGRIQVYNDIYFYCDGDSFKSCNIDGDNQKTVLEYARNPLIVGITVFYFDKQGNICKYSLRSTKKYIVVPFEKGAKEFVSYYKKIYYTDDNGNIRKTDYNGIKDELFVKANASNIAIDNQYIFYMEDGMVFSVQLNENKLIENRIVTASSYAVHNEYIMFIRDNKTYFGDMDKISGNDNSKKLKMISDVAVSSLSVDTNGCFYYFDENNSVVSFNSDTKKSKKLS